MAKRIVLATWGSLGDLHPYLAIALRLAARGHEPVLATSQIHRAKVEREGIRFAPLGPHLDPTDSELLRRAMDPRHGPEFLIRDVLYPYTQSAVREALRAIEGADLVVTHTVAFGAQLAAEKTGIPWLSGNLAPAGFFSAYDPPVLPPYVWMGRFYALGPVTGRAMRALGRSITRRWLAPIRATRARLGLPPDRDPLFDTQFSPRGTLALFSPLLGQPQPDWPPKVTLTGFAFYDRQQPETPLRWVSKNFSTRATRPSCLRSAPRPFSLLGTSTATASKPRAGSAAVPCCSSAASRSIPFPAPFHRE
jgi:rhamnosyltransferase subunit B